jgi:general secretion pathway protein D
VAPAPVPRLVTGERWLVGEAGGEIAQDGQAPGREQEGWVVKGTGEFVASPERPAAPVRGEGDITLNFENTDIREVVKVILGDLLGLNYILDPGVQGSATLQTGRPLSRDDLLPTLETLLRMNAAVLVYEDGVYRVLPSASGARGSLVPQLGDDQKPLPTGFNITVVPLRYVSAVEMEKILNPIAPEGSIIRVDGPRNLLVLAGTGSEVDNLLDTIEIFDVHWLQGLSVGFFPLEFIEVDVLVQDLDAVFGEQAESPLAGVLRLVPIASANGLLVVTQNPEYLDEVGGWVKRFDRPSAGGGDTQRLYVYRVKNADALDLADLLTNLFSDREGTSRTSRASIAPGLAPVTLRSGGNEESATSTTTTRSAARTASTLGPRAGESGLAGLVSEIKVVADEVNNSLLILATPRDYEKIREALDKLDIVPLQVVIEATILEVTLSDSFEFGLEWAFRFGNTNVVSLGGAGADDGGDTPGGVIGSGSAFSWSFVSGSADVRAILTAVASETALKVLSSPSVMVLDNQTASIDVGDEIPTLTASQSSSEGVSITNSIQYRKTGVQLQVTPRVNPGGLVIMEVNENVSNQADQPGLDGSPIIQNREIKSTVAVQSGQVVVLGGLIRENNDNNRSGVPGLYKIPVLGWAFGNTSESASRTELVVILKPRVISNRADADMVVEDFRKRLKGLEKRF